jgi:glycerol-3-phosphate dehydrogenase
VAALAARLGVGMPVAATVAALVAGGLAVPDAVEKLFNRPLRRE